jgi:large subunit ribosomal protein L1
MCPSKRLKEVAKLVDKDKLYSLEEAVSVLKKAPPAKFNESVEISVKLDIDTKKSDQTIRGSTKLPFGTGKTKRVLVFAEPDKEKEAKDAGADYVGSQELIDKISKGWIDFDYCISTPSMMKNVSRLGKVLGPRGLMPSPKVGGVTDNLAVAVKEAKGGKFDFKMDKFAAINASIGKISFSEDEIVQNVNAFLAGLSGCRPAGHKGKFVRSISLATTMGPGLRINPPKELQV